MSEVVVQLITINTSPTEIRTDKFDFWRAPLTGRKARIMAPPSDVEELDGILRMMNINFNVDSNDVQK